MMPCSQGTLIEQFQGDALMPPQSMDMTPRVGSVNGGLPTMSPITPLNKRLNQSMNDIFADFGASMGGPSLRNNSLVFAQNPAAVVQRQRSAPNLQFT